MAKQRHGLMTVPSARDSLQRSGPTRARPPCCSAKRDRIADEREGQADGRDWIADERDTRADERDKLADRRDRAADRHERTTNKRNPTRPRSRAAPWTSSSRRVASSGGGIGRVLAVHRVRAARRSYPCREMKGLRYLLRNFTALSVREHLRSQVEHEGSGAELTPNEVALVRFAEANLGQLRELADKSPPE